jgi:aminoglycoside phosphotransferase (APT) family kinase protein
VPSTPTSDLDQPLTTGAAPEVIGPFLAKHLYDERWLDCSVALIAGGMSNLTYAVHCGAGEVIVRRPPLGHILPTAHDMAREHRVISALADTPVPVPRTLLTAEAGAELEFACFVMERVLGHVCRGRVPDGYADDPAQRRLVGDAVVDVLAELHRVDPDAVGLGDFGRPEGFMERQLRRWSKQWEASKFEELPALDRLRDGLAARMPRAQQPATIVHGDYRIDNVILHPVEPGRIVAVLDWELSTLGDPLADLGAMLAYWADADDDEVLVAGRVVPPVTEAPGFPSRDEVIERYAERTGFDLSEIHWYMAFGYFKVAVICQGIAHRAAGGSMVGEGFDEAQGNVVPLTQAGLRVLETLGG